MGNIHVVFSVQNVEVIAVHVGNIHVVFSVQKLYTCCPSAVVHPVPVVAEVSDNDQCKAGLKLLLEKLPAPHSSTLAYLMAHFCRVCQHQDVIGINDPPIRLLQVFSFILMRPPWEHIM